MPMPPPTPATLTSDTGWKAGKLCHQAKCAVPITDPTIKNTSVISMRALPPPAVNSVPDAQPPPSCIPTPKINAPTNTEIPMGETKPRTSVPNRLPAPSAGKNSTTAIASMTICARSPRPRRSVINTRHAAVKPNAAWYSTIPSRPPTIISKPILALNSTPITKAPSTMAAVANRGTR